MGVVTSPLAGIALIAVLLSRDTKATPLMFSIGWICAVVVATIFYRLPGWIELKVKAEPAPWVVVARLMTGGFVGTGAVWTFRRSQVKTAVLAAANSTEDVVAAAPELPGWLNSVETFTASRPLSLGLCIFPAPPLPASSSRAVAPVHGEVTRSRARTTRSAPRHEPTHVSTYIPPTPRAAL